MSQPDAPDSAPDDPQEANRRLIIDLARAFAGALVFALPMLMTMELWQIGFYIEPLRLALLTILTIPMLVGLSHFSGFESTFRWRDDLEDACIAYAIGWLTAAAVLVMFAVVTPNLPFDSILGMIALEAVPASIGAILARSLFGSGGSEEEREQRKQQATYGGELFLMAVGAIFMAMNVAPTEEMILIAFKTTLWHTLALVIASLLIMHAFVYAVEFQGSHSLPPGTPLWSAFLRFTVVGYGVALVISLYILWTLGRAEGMALLPLLQSAVVLSFPAAIGAAGARLII